MFCWFLVVFYTVKIFQLFPSLGTHWKLKEESRNNLHFNSDKWCILWINFKLLFSKIVHSLDICWDVIKQQSQATTWVNPEDLPTPVACIWILHSSISTVFILEWLLVDSSSLTARGGCSIRQRIYGSFVPSSLVWALNLFSSRHTIIQKCFTWLCIFKKALPIVKV